MSKCESRFGKDQDIGRNIARARIKNLVTFGLREPYPLHAEDANGERPNSAMKPKIRIVRCNYPNGRL